MTRFLVHANLRLFKCSAAIVVVIVAVIVRRIAIVVVKVFPQWNPIGAFGLLVRSNDGVEFVFYLIVGAFWV